MTGPRHVLIGAGPASIAAAQAIRASQPHASITVVSAEREGYYSRPGLAYYLAKEVPENRLFPLSAEEFAELGLTFVHARAVEIRRAESTVLLEGGGALPYDRLLLATGSASVPLGVSGTHLDGVVKLDDLAEARDVLQRARRAKNAVVVGGGITALEIAEGLRARGLQVHYLMRKDRYWGDVLSEAESRLVEAGLEARGIRLHFHSELAEVLGDAGRIRAVRLADDTRLDCDILGAAIGVRPRIRLAHDAGLACERGVLVDEYMRTSDERIFAAGDIAETLHPASGKRTLEVLWNSAVEKGRVAGRAMADGPGQPYVHPLALNITRLGGYRTTIIGTVGRGSDPDMTALSRGDSDTWRDAADVSMYEWTDRETHVRLALVGDRIVGAVVMGEQELSFPLQDLIEYGSEVRGLGLALPEHNDEVSALLDSAWRERRIDSV
jgi:NAD(P)H-nitrite reductase large subunit